AAGLLDDASPETRIIAEAEEETGFKVDKIEKVFEAFMSPGSVTEKLYFYIAEYNDNNRSNAGGGLAEEGEDIEVLEWPFP
ncbi:GDP-mannose pyrophosphatase, partial [Escherichia coli]